LRIHQIDPTTHFRRVGGSAPILVLLALLAPPSLHAGDAFQDGEVFAGVAGGQISRFSAGGRSRGNLRTGGGQMTGMCFDLDGNLYATDFERRTMTKLDKTGRVVTRRWGGPFSVHPESCVVDGEGNVYTGELDGQNRIRKFTPDGRLLASFRPRTEERGVDWIDLAADQCTMFYTSEGRKVMRYDVCRDRQLGDFATGLEGSCYALRVRENGEVMVACEQRVYRLSAQGRVIGSYPIADGSLFAMNLDPDGEHFWTGGVRSGNVYKVHIESGRGTARPAFQASRPRSSDNGSSLFGALLGKLQEQFVGASLGGLAVYGERTAAIAEVVERREAAQREEKRRRAAEAEAQRRAAEAAEAKRRAAEAAETEAKRRAAEAAEAEAARRAAEAAEAERRAAEAEAERRRLEEERRRLEEERRRRARVSFGAASPVDFGRLAPGSRAEGLLDFSGSEVKGEPTARLSTDLDAAGVALEVEVDGEWRRVGSRPVEVTLAEGGENRWRVRLRVGECTEGVPEGASHHLRVDSTGPDRTPAALELPLAVVVAPSPPLRCWWPVLAGGLGCLLLGVVIHGFVSPSRFGPRVGVLLSPEEDMDEGFFHPIRAQRGSGSGFYRDARIHVGQDFRLTSKAGGAAARLRAEGQQVRIQPAPGASLERQSADGEWEPVPAEESPMRPGAVYRTAVGSLYFQLARR